MNRFTLTLLLLVAKVPAGWCQIQITHSPYLQALHDTGVTIVWTTDKDAIGWVELAPDDGSHFYKQERPKYFASSHGFKNVSTVHKVTLRGLAPGTTYRYRVYAQEVTSHVGTNVTYGDIAATRVYRQEPLAFTTSTPGQQQVSFAVVNDIHGRNEVMKNLLDQLDWPTTDLVFFNGDMADNLQNETQLFAHYMDTATVLFASETPMYYARGNHETRGNFASAFADYFPTTSGHLYYLLRRGPVCFVVLDCGEDKPDSDIEYSGIVNMDAYRTQQAEWLAKALQQPEYQDAPYKVIICHMPPFGGWHGEEEIAAKFVPLLNAAEAQVMLSGHLHRHIKREAEPGLHDFPVLVNSNNNMLRVTADSQQLHIDVVDQTGKVVDTLALRPSREGFAILIADLTVCQFACIFAPSEKNMDTNTDNYKHLDIIVSGKVQGVYFRFTTKAVADQLGVKGTAQNKPDGTVAIEAEGDAIALDAFLEWCHEGPERAVVEKVVAIEGEMKNYRNFEVIRKSRG